jgi:hypothetical protein
MKPSMGPVLQFSVSPATLFWGIIADHMGIPLLQELAISG